MRYTTTLRMKNIHYSFGNFEALHGVDMDIRAGEIHALVGEHRSGKSTLMKILSGNLVPQRGEILLNGKTVQFTCPEDALARGIGMVHQSIMVIPSINTVENIFSGRMPAIWFGYKKYGRMLEESRRLLKDLGQNFNLMTPLSNLSAAQQQMVEIARILSLSPDIYILDEISNRLNSEELVHLFRILADLKSRGKSIIYITQNFDEIFELADRVTVLQDGYRKSTENVADLDRMRLYRLAFEAVLDSPVPSEIGTTEEERQLISLRKYSRGLIEDLPIGVLIFDAEGTVYQVNNAAAEILDYSRESISGRNISSLNITDDSLINNEIINTLSNKGKGVWEGIKIGTAKFVKVRVLPLFDDNFSFLGSLLTLEDASLNALVKEYLTEAEKHQYTAELAAGVAHEVNNPLGIINNYLEILKLKNFDSDTLIKLEKIQKEIKRITEIIGSLLSFSRVPKKRKTNVNIIELMNEVILLLGHRFAEKKILVEKRYYKKPIIISGDENRLKQVFINLLINSQEAVLDEGRIIVKIENSDEFVIITISDNGHGIPKEAEKSILQPFFTTKLTKTNTGLGLSICDHIVKAHGGKLFFESTPGEWTHFYVQFPLLST